MSQSSTVAALLAVLRRRSAIILLAGLLVPVGALALALSAPSEYEASAQVYIDSHDPAATALTGIAETSGFGGADRYAKTQAALARTPEVARRTIAALRLRGSSIHDVLAAISVDPQADSDILVFTGRGRTPAAARRLTNEFARQFTVYTGTLDTASVVRARAEVRRQLAALEAAGREDGDLYEALTEKSQLLAALRVARENRAIISYPADVAVQTAPRPVRDAILGLLLGGVLGVVLALLVDALDTRVRSAAEITELLGQPLLARLPSPPRRLARRDRLVMLAQPTGPHAESFRMLRSNVEFTLLGRDERTILVTSAVDREGKSTTVANLAVALARGGRRVALVDLDLRRPHLHRFFDVPITPGISDVALGRASLEGALRPVDLGTGTLAANHPQVPAGPGLLAVLPRGPLPPQPGEFVGSAALRTILARLEATFDLVLVDVPPMLRVGDAMTLGAAVDGILVVARLNVIRRPLLQELKRLLDATPVRTLGFVATGSGGDADTSGFDYSYGTPYGSGDQDAVDAEPLATGPAPQRAERT